MPKITKGGVSNRLVDPDFIAEPGTPVEKAIDEGLPNVNDTEDQHRAPDGQDVDRDRQADDEQPKGNDPGANGRDQKPMGNEFPAHDEPPKKTTAPKKNTTPSKR